MRRTANLSEPRGGASAGEDRAPEPATAPDAVLAEARRLAEEAGPDAALPGLLARIEEAPGGAPVRLLAAELLARSGRADEGEALLRAGLAETPGDRDLAAAYARTAQARGDKTEAAARWLAYRERFADDPLGYEMAGGLLLELGRADDAEQVLTEGSWLQQPGSEVLRNHARAAQQRADWPEALRRWDTFREQYPHDPGGYSGASFARHQLALEQVRQADALMEEALRLFPSNGDIIGTYARLAQTRRDWPAALSRWYLCRQRLSDDPVAFIGIGVALRELGRLDEAEAALRDGIAAFPGHVQLLNEYARLADTRQDWEESAKRWAVVQEMSPEDLVARERLRMALELCQRGDEAPPATDTTAPTDPRSAARLLLMRFESLGDNCQFGIVQGRYDAQPLGLLRFTSTPLHALIKALNAKLAGIGDPDNTTIEVSNDEYVTIDKNYDMTMHTFMKVNQRDDREAQRQRFLHRLQYLRDKLLTDLTTAEKIFVYSTREHAADDTITELWQALDQYGSNTLLFVTLQDDEHRAGELVKINDRLFIGYIDYLENESPSLDVWLELCRQVAASRPNLPH